MNDLLSVMKNFVEEYEAKIAHLDKLSQQVEELRDALIVIHNEALEKAIVARAAMALGIDV